MSFSSSRTAYSSVVRVSSTSSTIKTFFPIRLAISNELRSNHCVRVTFVPGTSSGSSRPKSSYRERPMAWIGMLGSPGRFKNDLDGDDQTVSYYFRNLQKKSKTIAMLSSHYRISHTTELFVRHVPKNSSRNIAAATDCDNEIGMEVLEDFVR